MSRIMASRIAELERENKRLNAIISDLQEQIGGLIVIAGHVEFWQRRAITAQAWANRWKRAAKQARGCYQEALSALDNAIRDYADLKAKKS